MLKTMCDALQKQDYLFLALEVRVVSFGILVAFKQTRNSALDIIGQMDRLITGPLAETA